MNVHNHGTEEGPGLGCKERLIGSCRLDAMREALAEMVYRVERGGTPHQWRESTDRARAALKESL